MMRRAATVAALTSAALLLVARGERASAQVDTSGDWRFAVTPYFWALSLHGRVGVGPVATDANVSFRDILEALRFAALADVQARRGPWFADIDAIYASLGKENVVAVRGDTGTLTLTAKMTIVQPVAGYTIGNAAWAVDFLGGARLWNLNTTLDVDVTRRPSNPHTLSRGWADATAGFRLRGLPYRKLHLVVAGDGGGGGSRATWQASALLGYDAWSRVALGAGYRYLSVNYDKDNFLWDVSLRGAGLGATIHW